MCPTAVFSLYASLFIQSYFLVLISSGVQVRVAAGAALERRLRVDVVLTSVVYVSLWLSAVRSFMVRRVVLPIRTGGHGQ
jgi:hypothetical protein